MKKTSTVLFAILLCSSSFLNAQSVPVTFLVNMSYQISQGKFDPAKEYVDIAGTFNSWGAQQVILGDANSDQIYEAVVNLTAGSSVEYKFRINGAWNGREEFPNGGSNRAYTVKAGDNYVFSWYNNELSLNGKPAADFTATSLNLFENGIITFEDRSAGLITARQWFFEGGQPSVSSEQNPSVLYKNAGTYSVKLIVSSSSGSDTLLRTGYINVKKRGAVSTSWWNNSVFYEIFVRSFYDSDGNGIGDFRGITQKLDYLKDLGISGIWLMPVNPSPSYHGYDATNYRAVNPAYGTMNDFREFVSEAHKRGIRIIIDYVMNHSSSQHSWFQQSAANNPVYRNFYRWSAANPGYSGPLGTAWHRGSSGYYYGVFNSAMPDLNYEDAALKDSIFSTAGYWLNDIGIDGFRLDAILYLVENGTQGINTEGTYNLLRDFTRHIKQVKPESFAVGEAWTNTETVSNYVNNDRLDYCFEFDLASAILSAVNTGNAVNLTLQMQKVYNLYPFLQYGTFLTNHDQNRVMSVVGSIQRARTAASIYLTLPGIPYLYYGEEIGMSGSKPDQYIRTPMQWNSSTNAGFTTAGSPWIGVNSNYTVINAEAQLADSASLLRWYKKLIALRNQEPALRLGEYEALTSPAQPVMAFLRHYQDRSLLVVINTGQTAQTSLTLKMRGLSIKPGTYQLTDILNGNRVISASVNSSFEISGIAVEGMQTLVYSFPNGSNTGVKPEEPGPGSFRLDQNYPNPFNPVTTISYSIAEQCRVEIKIFDMLGRELAVLADQAMGKGEYKTKFDASSLPSGMYIYRLKAGSFSDSRKLLLIK